MRRPPKLLVAAGVVSAAALGAAVVVLARALAELVAALDELDGART